MPAESVFMSSTSTDLKQHRAAVNEALRKSGYHAVDMADFGARSEGATSACLDEVADSDIFVGIYAWRYGFVPPGSSVSITEQEFDEARRLNKQCFCFMVDETMDWPDEFVESGPGAERLATFKARVEAELVRATFTTPDNLALQVVTSLTRRERGQQKLLVEAASAMIPGATSHDEALDMIGTTLEEQQVTFEFEEGAFYIPYGSTFLVVDVRQDERLGLIVVFRALLADELTPERLPADIARSLLALSSTMPIGAVALDQSNGTLWYQYTLPAALLTKDTVFSCVSHVAVTADSLDDEIRESLPALEPPKQGWRKRG